MASTCITVYDIRQMHATTRSQMHKIQTIYSKFGQFVNLALAIIQEIYMIIKVDSAQRETEIDTESER